RLGMWAKEQEIAVTVGEIIAENWVNSSRYLEAQELCREILQLGENYRILGTIARAETTLGFVEDALRHYQTALQLCPEDDLTTKAATLHNMAGLKAQQGKIQDAIALYQQSLEITDSIKDVGGKAATLANLAYWEGKRGNKTQQLELNLEAAQIFGQSRAYIDLRLVLKNLGVTDETKGIIYLAQAVWLCLGVQVPLTDTVDTFTSMYQLVPKAGAMKALLGTAVMYLCQIRGAEHPQLEELQQRSGEILSGAAQAQGIETQEAFDSWIVQQRLNDPEYFMPRLVEKLEEIVGDGWLFERF
ncbi:MAG: tetratricopeptide repeat protein, partial [Coleofasciculaceae cyanobacterium]